MAEGDSGATFTITRSPGSPDASSVQWSTADGSATAPADYTAVAPTTVSFAAGETTKTVTVAITGDTAVEPDETFTVKLTSASGAVITDASGTATITKDD